MQNLKHVCLAHLLNYEVCFGRETVFFAIRKMVKYMHNLELECVAKVMMAM